MPRNWKSVVGYEGFYEVSDDGSVRRTPDSPFAKGVEVLKPDCTSLYPRVALSRSGVVRRRRVHLLVLEAFRGPKPAGMCSRHLNDVRTNNRLDNLAWGTYSENYDDQHKNGRHKTKRWLPRGTTL